MCYSGILLLYLSLSFMFFLVINSRVGMLFKANNLQRSFLWTLSVSGGVLWTAKHWTGPDYDNLESIMSSETLGCDWASVLITVGLIN